MSDTTCPVLRPSHEEFLDFRAYLRIIDSHYESGIVKIIPPEGYTFKRDYDPEALDITLSHYYEQGSRQLPGCKGVYDLQIKWKDSQTIKLIDFMKLLDTSCDIKNKKGDPLDKNIQKESWIKREQKFWKLLGDKKVDSPKYAGDINVSLFGNGPAHSWNLNRLNSLLQSVGQHYGGVTDSMCYMGQYRSMFACHIEDMDLYSINYLHTGLPKSWYSISPSQRSHFEQIATALYPEEAAECPNFLRHKNKVFSKKFLEDNGIRVHTVVQLPGEYVVTMPGAYHFGFNHGYNIAEATNFATPRWFDIGRLATRCTCERDNVFIDPWKINRMETLWLRQRNYSYTSPVTGAHKRMRCSCEMNDIYNSEKQIWNIKDDKKKTIFNCAACRLWCHWSCIFGDTPGDAIADEDAYLLCHICNALEHSEEPVSIVPVIVDEVTGNITVIGDEDASADDARHSHRRRSKEFGGSNRARLKRDHEHISKSTDTPTAAVNSRNRVCFGFSINDRIRHKPTGDVGILSYFSNSGLAGFVTFTAATQSSLGGSDGEWFNLKDCIHFSSVSSHHDTADVPVTKSSLIKTVKRKGPLELSVSSSVFDDDF
jgi:[histone H3]-trimethyl-L-lysine9/36 demethylase